MRNVVLLAAILSVTPGFVCGMEEEREKDYSSLLKPLKIMEMTVEDVKTGIKKRSSKLKKDLGCPKCCADDCATCDTICGCGFVEESIDRFVRDSNCEDGCPMIGVSIGAASLSVLTGTFFGYSLLIISRIALTYGDSMEKLIEKLKAENEELKARENKKSE